MGYTHYWERLCTLPLPLFAKAVEDCRRLCEAMQIPLGDADGKGLPTFTAAEICFNGHVDSGQLTSMHNASSVQGAADDTRALGINGGWRARPLATARMLGANGDGSYETFRVARICRLRSARQEARGKWSGDFCKTNHRPYDLCVQGCLIVLNHHLGSDRFRVSSDGKSRDWDEARNACQQILGYGIDWGEDQLAPASPPGSTQPAPPPVG